MEAIHRGYFYSREGVRWDVEILRESGGRGAGVGWLSLSGEEPLVIEWAERGKEEPLCGSTATLNVLSPGDRTYIDLYSVQAGEIRLDVRREGVLYWRGTLDPEFYEEPYAPASDYEVRLTFSDLGMLDRERYDLTGLRTVGEVVRYGLGRIGLGDLAVDETLISTRIESDGPAMGLGDLTVRSDNFYDEDGEALSLGEVLTGVLQPLGLRMEQRGGVVWIYDLHGLYTSGSTAQVEWMSDDQTLGVDVVYNNATVRWSTYVQSGNLMPTDCWVTDTDATLTALNVLEGAGHGESTYYSYHYTQDAWEWADGTDAGFTLWTSRTGKNATLEHGQVAYFKIVAQLDGEDAEGVAISHASVRYVKVGDGKDNATSITVQPNGMAPYAVSVTVKEGTHTEVSPLIGHLGRLGGGLWRSQGVWLPPVTDASGLCVRVTLEVLADPRFNPFEDAVNWGGGLAQEDWHGQWAKWGNYVYVPVVIRWDADDGSAYVWDNRGVVARDVSGDRATTLGETLGHWVPYDGDDTEPRAWGYLAYYDAEDRAEKSGACGWRKNRPAINPHTGRLTSGLARCEDGQYLPYPTTGGRRACGGRLSVEVRMGWMISDGGENLSATEVQNPHDLWNKLEWVLTKLPEVEVLERAQFASAPDTDDVVYSAQLNRHAKEGLEIETLCGSAAGGVALARGAYYRTEDLRQVETLSRAGRTAQIEELLTGTLYSQYASRRTRLEGTTRLGPPGLRTWREAMQGDRKLMETGSTEDVGNDTSERVLVELRPDEYDKKTQTD